MVYAFGNSPAQRRELMRAHKQEADDHFRGVRKRKPNELPEDAPYEKSMKKVCNSGHATPLALLSRSALRLRSPALTCCALRCAAPPLPLPSATGSDAGQSSSTQLSTARGRVRGIGMDGALRPLTSGRSGGRLCGLVRLRG